MPKIVNHNNQKEIIAEAAWRVIRNVGIENASVRKIAQEAGISSGALQHYFNSQSQLLEFAMKMVVERVEQRFANISKQVSAITLSNAKELLLNLMPMDKDRELEMEIWLSLTVKAFHEPSLSEISQGTYSLIYQTILAMLKQLDEAHLLKRGLNLEMEAKRLHILLDGLSLHRMICPDAMSIEQINAIINQHLGELSND